MRKIKLQNKGFTIAELNIALMVAFIILAAVVTLAQALSSAYESTRDMNEKQARVRYAMMRITDEIKNCRLVLKASSSELLIWENDDNEDNQINISELLFIETGAGNYLRLLEFAPAKDTTISFSFSQNAFLKPYLIYLYPEAYTTIIDQCSDVNISVDKIPPYTQRVTMTFGIEENNQTRTYQINTVLRSRADNLIRSSSSLYTSDDDS